MLSKLGMNQVSTRRYVTVVNSCTNEFVRHAQPLDVLPRTWTFRLFTGGPVEGGRLVSYPGPREVWGASPSLRNIKYTRMRHFNKENSKIFFPEGSHENIFPGPAVAFDEPCFGNLIAVIV